MNDTTDGSSRAAHSAPTPQIDGIFGRIFAWGKSLLLRVKPHREDDPPSPAPNETVKPGMLNLRRLVVADVLVPKAEIEAVPASISKADLVEVFRKSGYSRVPVFEGTLDTPLGFVHLKDLALKFGFPNSKAGRFSLRGMMRPLLFVPPSMPIGILLAKMQAERIHIALVIDEYGGTDGLLTIEDLIEQVIGDIEDEHDIAEGAFWIRERGGSYVAKAKTPLEIFENEIGIDLTAHEDIHGEEIDTLGGLVVMLAGRVPARTEVLFHPSGLEFEVVDADPRRIKRVRVRTGERAVKAAE